MRLPSSASRAPAPVHRLALELWAPGHYELGVCRCRCNAQNALSLVVLVAVGILPGSAFATAGQEPLADRIAWLQVVQTPMMHAPAQAMFYG